MRWRLQLWAGTERMRTGDTGRTKSLSARKEDKIMEKETKPMYTWFFLLSGGILVFIVYYG